MPSIIVTYPPTADDLALLAKLGIGGASTGTGGNTDFFPTDPTTAPFPSPENSQVINTAGVIGGRPYLKDSDGTIHTLKVISGVVNWMKGNNAWAGDPSLGQINQLLVRQGKVFCQDGVIWKDWTPVSVYNTTLPPAWTTSGGGSTTPNLPALPALPTPSAVAPGSSGKIINCGSGQTLATLSAAIPTAKAGDTVKLAAGTYTDTPPAWTVPLLVDLGGATFNATGKTASLARGKGLLVPSADSIIQNGTITGVAMDQGSGQLTSGVRPDDGCGYLTLKNLQLHGNQCAVGEGGISVAIELDNCNISNNGLKVNSGSLTHDLYVSCRRLTLVNVIANGAVEGHAIKYRGPELIVTGGTFASAPGKPFDMPDGSTVPFKITNAALIKGATDPDHGVLAYGEESGANGLIGGSITGGSIVAACPNPSIITMGGTITVTATITGGKITASGGGTVTGI
jgi:hypothetical protein